MTRVRRDTHLPYYTENPRKNLHLLGKLTFPSNACALLGKVVIVQKVILEIVRTGCIRYKFSMIEKIFKDIYLDDQRPLVADR